MSDGKKSAGEKALAAVSGLSVSVLGYELTANPEGFVLAVLYQELVSIVSGFANGIANGLYGYSRLLVTLTVDGLAAAGGPVGEVLGDGLLLLVGFVNMIGEAVASAGGPIGFVLFPVVWAIALVAAVATPIAAWRLYKWIRVVVV